MPALQIPASFALSWHRSSGNSVQSMDPVRHEKLLHLYKGLVEVSALINGITESAELMPAILDVARRVFNVQAASLFLVNADGDLELTSASGEEDIPGTRLVVPRGKGVS